MQYNTTYPYIMYRTYVYKYIETYFQSHYRLKLKIDLTVKWISAARVMKSDPGIHRNLVLPFWHEKLQNSNIGAYIGTTGMV